MSRTIHPKQIPITRIVIEREADVYRITVDMALSRFIPVTENQMRFVFEESAEAPTGMAQWVTSGIVFFARKIAEYLGEALFEDAT